jgi:hypothetical protein
MKSIRELEKFIIISIFMSSLLGHMLSYAKEHKSRSGHKPPLWPSGDWLGKFTYPQLS